MKKSLLILLTFFYITVSGQGILSPPVNLSYLQTSFNQNTSKPYVILGGGQSNQLGSAAPAEGDHTIDANIWVWNANAPGGTTGTAWIPASYSSLPFNLTGGSVNASIWFANYLRRSGKIPSTRPIYIILNAVSGQPIERWLAADATPTLWTNLTGQIAASGIDHIDHMIWMQGEANANAGAGAANTAALYNTAFYTFVGQLRALSVWKSYTTMSVSELGPWALHTSYDRNDFIQSLANGNDPLIGFVSAAGTTETSLVVGSHAHFSGASLQLLGQRHFAAMSAMTAALGKGNGGAVKTPDGYAQASIKDNAFSTGTITSNYVISSDDIRSGGLYTASGTLTITIPDANKQTPLSKRIVINALTAGTITIAPTAPSTINAGGIALSGSNLVLPNIGRYTLESENGVWYLTSTFPNIGNAFGYVSGAETPGANINVSTAVMQASHRQAVNNTFSFFSPALVPGGKFSILNRDPAATTLQLTSPSLSVNGRTTEVLNPGTGYVPANTITIAGGTGTAATVTIATTQVSGATVAAGGSGGTNGTQTVTGTTGTGTKFTASVTVSGGAITGVLSITTGGAYTVNPTSLAAEPVTGASLSGATLTITMGVGTITASTALGSYTVLPPNPGTQASTSGSGTGATFNLQFNGLFRGPHPRLQQIAVPMSTTNQVIDIEQRTAGLQYDVVRNTGTQFPTLQSAALSSGTLTDSQMQINAIYDVNASAALVLPFAKMAYSGETLFVATNGSFTITAQGTDSILYNGTFLAAGVTVTVAQNTAIKAYPLYSKKIWVIQ